MADQGGIQLLQETRKSIVVRVPGENRLLYLGITAAAMVFVLFVGLNSYANSLETKVQNIDAQLVALNRQRDKKTEQNLVALSKQAQLISQLLDQHVKLTSVLRTLESSLQSQVRFKNFSLTTITQELTFQATAGNYSSVARQIASFLAAQGISDVKVTNVKTLNTGGTEFGMTIKLQTELLQGKSVSTQ
ncbi:MAG: hypothetical protein KW806_02405 [Candidatus Yanofskybacteria bacterium]|nr:hypothetical protein [Candidatus Yanofskybacteria bacterium]